MFSTTNPWLLSVLFSLIGFALGSIPFSVLIGQLGAGVDIRRYGDHNPGSTNVLRAAGWKLATPAFLLDYLKGALPVGIAWFWVGLSGYPILPVALAPVLGHAFSPWLRWRGGKAVAATFGIWTGLTIGAGPTILGLLLGVMFAVLENSSWALTLGFILFGGFILTEYAPTYPELGAVWLGNLIILLIKHAGDLGSPPAIRKSLMQKIARRR